MTSQRMRVGFGITGLLVLVTVSIVSLPASARLHTRDTNGDGRPDVWQYFDNRGSLVRVNRDTNFDGRSDVQEWYEDGRLVRRETDRNFDDRVDLIDEFDATTGARTRAVFDADFDGRADLLVLFADGTPVFTKWATPEETAGAAALVETPSDRDSDNPLLRLGDPFSTAETIRRGTQRIATSVACVTLRWIAPVEFVFSPRLGEIDLAAARSLDPASVSVHPSRPRGPPRATPSV